jgi:hypothetical protein
VVRVEVLDITGGERRSVVFEGDSVQMTETSLRDPDGEVLLYLNEITSRWVVFATGHEWDDFVVSVAK